MIFHVSPGIIDLGINVDHVTALRDARNTTCPDPVAAALLAEEAGVDPIILHLREDRHHIRDADIRALRPRLRTHMNLECTVTRETLDIACDVDPQDVCLVPERRREVTTEGDLDVVSGFAKVQAAYEQLADAGIHVSLFIDPDVVQIEATVTTGTPVIELHTGRYAGATDNAKLRAELVRIETATEEGIHWGMRANAGHGLHYTNVQPITAIAGTHKLNIDCAVVAHAVFAG